MRRLLRHLFTTCSALSLVLCVAVGVLWVRTVWRTDEFNLYWNQVQTPWPEASNETTHVKSVSYQHAKFLSKPGGLALARMLHRCD